MLKNKQFIKWINHGLIVSFIVIVLLSILVKFANTKIGYDTGMYHLQKVLWLSEYGHVPGLANLDGRLGFYSLYFYIGVLVNQFFNSNSTLLYINLSFFFSYIIIIGYFLLKETDVNFKIVYALSLLGLIFYFGLLKSLSQDVGGFIVIQLSFLWLLKKITYNEWFSAYKLLLIMAFIVSIKFSYVFLVVGVLPLFPLLKGQIKLKSTKYYLLATCALVCLFFYHNIILTGWIIYPFSGIDLFSMDWKVPVYLVQNQEVVTKLFAKSPGSIEHLNKIKDFGLLEWIPLWLEQNKSLYWLIIITISSQILNFGVLITSINKLKKVIILQIVISICLIAWFLSAPSIRFGFTWMLLSLTLNIYLLLEIFKQYSVYKYSSKIIYGITLILISYIFLRNSGIISYLRHNYPPLSFKINVEIPEVEMKKVMIPNSNEFIYVPLSGERPYFNKSQPVASRLFIDSIMPFINDIPRRRGATLQEGFYTDSLQTIRKNK